MKHFLLGFSLLMMLPLCVQAQQSKIHGNNGVYSYKCHLVLEDKREVIRDYWRQPKNQNGNLERILVNQQVAVEQDKRLAIVDVLECVARDAEFSKVVSRELYRYTLR